jgi:hypothetical protein
LPKLIDRSRFVFELIGCLDDDKGWLVIRSCALSVRYTVDFETK